MDYGLFNSIEYRIKMHHPRAIDSRADRGSYLDYSFFFVLTQAANTANDRRPYPARKLNGMSVPRYTFALESRYIKACVNGIVSCVHSNELQARGSTFVYVFCIAKCDQFVNSHDCTGIACSQKK